MSVTGKGHRDPKVRCRQAQLPKSLLSCRSGLALPDSPAVRERPSFPRARQSIICLFAVDLATEQP